jgi:hypothetical protein
MRKSGFQYEAQIFEHRRTLIAKKRKLGLEGDDDDLVYHRVCARKYIVCIGCLMLILPSIAEKKGS